MNLGLNFGVIIRDKFFVDNQTYTLYDKSTIYDEHLLPIFVKYI